MNKQRSYQEIIDLIMEAERIPLDEIIEPEGKLEPGQHLLGKVRHADLKRLHTLMQRLAQQVDDFRARVIYLGGIENVPHDEIATIQRVTLKHEAVREIFFMTLFLRFPSVNAQGVGVAKGWQVFYQEKVKRD